LNLIGFLTFVVV